MKTKSMMPPAGSGRPPICRESPASASAAKSHRSFPLWQRVLAAVVVGIVLGLAFGSQPIFLGFGNKQLGQLGILIIRLLKTLAVPLVLLSILDSFMRTRISARQGRRLALICFMNAAVALFIGLTLLNVLKPGAQWRGRVDAIVANVKAHEDSAKVDAAQKAAAGASLGVVQNLEAYIPSNLVDPFHDNNLITLVAGAVLAGIALRRAKDQQDAAGLPGGQTLAALIATLYKAILTMLSWVIQAVPWAVLGIIAASVGANGIAVFRPLFPLLRVLLAGLAVHGLVYYPLMAWLGGVRPRQFFTDGADAVLTAASGNSSLAAVPVTLAALDKLGVSQESSRLSACVGTNFNNDGITLYEAMVALFLAQACGMDLTLSQQGAVVLASLLAGVGVAGVPEAGLVVLPLVLAAAGFPEPIVVGVIPLLMPIDWIVARARSAVNVMSDMVVAILLDRAARNAVRKAVADAL